MTNLVSEDFNLEFLTDFCMQTFSEVESFSFKELF